MSLTNEWAFPSLEGGVDEKTFDRNIDKRNELDERDKRLIELENMLNSKNEELVHLRGELLKIESLKSEHENQLITITNAIHNIIPDIKAQIASLIVEMVNKISVKVLRHEIDSNHQIMTSLIQGYITELEKNELVKIEVGPDDYERLNQIQFDTKAKWSVNPDMKKGDVIVHSEVSAIRLVLNDMIDQITGECADD